MPPSRLKPSHQAVPGSAGPQPPLHVLEREADDETFDRLRKDVETFPPFREQAPWKRTFAVRHDPRFEEALR